MPQIHCRAVGKRNTTFKVVKEADPSDPQEYFNMRVAMINGRRAAGQNPFPHKVTHR